MQKRKILAAFTIVTFTLLLTACHTENTPNGSDHTDLPISKKPLTLTCLVYPSEEFLKFCDGDFNNSLVFKELEERTNIHINWITSTDELQSQYQFNQSDNSTPDLIQDNYQNYFYGTSLDSGVDKGDILNLTEMIPKYAPNYYKIIQDPALRPIVYTASGRLAAIYSIKKGVQGPWAGLQIRKDWLDELGLEIPVTYQEWETVLTAFKEKKGATAPLWISSNGYFFDNCFSAGFHVTSSFFHIDDTIHYGPAQSGWKDYLSLMKRWYEKGLIDPNFMTGTSTYPERDMLECGTSGAWFDLYTAPSTLSFLDNPEGAKVVAVAPPKKNVSDQGHIRMADTYVDSYFTISSTCEHPVEALQWLDYLFSDEGALLANYGIEGMTYTLNGDGSPVYTDYMTANPDGLSFSEAVRSLIYPPGVPSFYVDWKREWQALPKEDIAMCDVWAIPDSDYLLPSGINLTPGENDRFSAIMEKLSPYVQDYTIRFITNMDSLESGYEAFLSGLQTLGLPEAVQILQNAYNRYLKTE